MRPGAERFLRVGAIAMLALTGCETERRDAAQSLRERIARAREDAALHLGAAERAGSLDSIWQATEEYAGEMEGSIAAMRGDLAAVPACAAQTLDAASSAVDALEMELAQHRAAIRSLRDGQAPSDDPSAYVEQAIVETRDHVERVGEVLDGLSSAVDDLVCDADASA